MVKQLTPNIIYKEGKQMRKLIGMLMMKQIVIVEDSEFLGNSCESEVRCHDVILKPHTFRKDLASMSTFLKVEIICSFQKSAIQLNSLSNNAYYHLISCIDRCNFLTNFWIQKSLITSIKNLMCNEYSYLR
jgi:hypothetical protein